MYKYLKEKRFKVLLIPLILYWIILFIGTTLPSENLSDVLQLSDKLKHFFAYFFLAILLSLNFHFQQKWDKLASNAFIYAFFTTVVYGIFDELHQILVPNRSAELLDWVADALGSLAGIIISYFFVNYLRKNQVQTET